MVFFNQSKEERFEKLTEVTTVINFSFNIFVNPLPMYGMILQSYLHK